MPSSLSRTPSGDVGDADSWLERCFRKFRWELLVELVFIYSMISSKGVCFLWDLPRVCQDLFQLNSYILPSRKLFKIPKKCSPQILGRVPIVFRPNPPQVDMVNIFPMNHRVFVSMPTWNNRILCLKNGVFRWWGGICSLRFMQWSSPCFCFVPSSISRRLFIIFLAGWKQCLEESLLSILSLVPLERKHNGKNTL